MEHLVILHRPTPGLWTWSAAFPEWQMWGTCLRQLAIAVQPTAFPPLAPSDDCWQGAEAYRELLKIVCGLRSPVLGETEVFGQFKNFIEQVRNPGVAQVLAEVLADAKRLRHEHLRGGGGQSYGSLVRKEVRGARALHLIGYGHLSQELLPWLNKMNLPLTIHTRRPQHVKAGVFGRALNARGPLEGAIILAAPMSAREFRDWLQDAVVEKVIDLRGESAVDPLELQIPVVDLSALMSKLAKGRSHQEAHLPKVFAAIETCVEKRGSQMKVRPLGWEDLCG